MSRFFRSKAVLFFVLACLALFAGCVNETVGKRSSFMDNLRIYDEQNVYNFSPLGSRFNLDPPMQGDAGTLLEEEDDEHYDPFKKYSKQTYYHADGSITRHYYLPPGRGENISKLLVGQVPGLTNIDLVGKTIENADITQLKKNHLMVFANAITDMRESGQVPWMTGFTSYNHKTGSVADLMILKAKDQDKLMEVDSYLTNLLTEPSMVEIKVKVVEISVSDIWQWGNENLITRDTGSEKSFLKEWFNLYNTDTMITAGDEADFQGTLFNAFGIHDKFVLDATFELLQRTTDADVLTAPTVTVMDGHRAIIETGDEIPSGTIAVAGDQAYLNYVYTQTGVTLVIVPHHLPDDIIEVEVNAQVKAVTGKETFDTPAGTLSQPIYSKRNASTRIRIKEGQAFALGGLMATSEFEVVTKLPLLGDIPILGFLFKSVNVEKRQSQIIFYIEPRVVRRTDSWRKRAED